MPEEIPQLIRHFKIPEIAKAWNLCPDAVRKIFADEPGVLRIFRNSRNRKRKYVTVLVPASVLARVYERLQKAR